MQTKTSRAEPLPDQEIPGTRPLPVVVEEQPRLTYTQEQLRALRDAFSSDQLSDAEFQVFLYTAQRLGLDPLTRQVYPVKRRNRSQGRDVVRVQVSIDGARAVGARTGEYAGADDILFRYGPNDPVEDRPLAAQATVYRLVQGQRYAFTATARWAEYFPGEELGFMWNRMPHVMLGKCAEMQALRRAFPAQLGGIYIPEEMEQADVGDGAQKGAPASATGAPAHEPPARQGPGAKRRHSGFKGLFGPHKGKPVEDLKTERLTEMLEWARKKDPTKWAQWIETVELILDDRRQEPPAAEAAASGAEGPSETEGGPGLDEVPPGEPPQA